MPVIIWINGGFGAGKTTLAQELHQRLPGAVVYDPETSGAVKLPSRDGVCRVGWRGECGGLVVVLAGCQAVVEAAE